MIKIGKDWLRTRRTEECNSPWSSPSFPVPKKKPGEYRGVVDCRYVNTQCQDDAYPIPRIDDHLVKQGRKKVFTILDLKDAFHQIPLKKEDRYIFATSTPLG